MINSLDDSFIQQIKSHLDGLKKSNNKYNFRCPLCGDSHKNSKKQRGWLLDYEGHTIFKCFNCDQSLNFANFLKYIDEGVYRDYLAQTSRYKINVLRENPTLYNKTPHSDIISVDGLKNAICCDKTSKSHIYLRGRNITHPELFYHTSNYGALLEELKLTKYEGEWNNDTEKLVIPHYTRSHKLAFIQLRSLLKDTQFRYKTYRILEDEPKIWGLERLDLNKNIFICEGALDASLLDNGIAMSGSDVSIDSTILKNYKDKLYFIMDNEPYNKEIAKKYMKLAENGYNVFIWPSVDTKDINDYWSKYHNLDIFYDLNNYKKDLMLKLELSRWLKNT